MRGNEREMLVRESEFEKTRKKKIKKKGKGRDGIARRGKRLKEERRKKGTNR